MPNKRGLNALQDDCWDQICPYTQQGGKEGKLNCFMANADKICECCNARGLSDCKVLIPGKGLMDACAISGGNEGGKLSDSQIEFIKNKLANAIKADNDEEIDDKLVAELVNCMYPELSKIIDMVRFLPGTTFDINILSDDEKNKLDNITRKCTQNIFAKITERNAAAQNSGAMGKITRNIPKNVLMGIVALFILLIVLSIFFSMKKK